MFRVRDTTWTRGLSLGSDNPVSKISTCSGAYGQIVKQLTVEMQAAKKDNAVDAGRVIRDALSVPLLRFLVVANEVVVAVRQPPDT